ncbi:MAG: DUF2271 domain-containing protein [Salinivirgaceae bacterium]|nr:DUF2271 domain-containing protein [Salinivirgaceae bacterium]
MKISKKVITLMFSIGLTCTLAAQTTGMLNFQCNTSAPNGDWGTKHAAAIWIQNNDNPSVFIKTNAKFGHDNDHLTSWTSISGSNIVDAVTGATLSSYGQLSVQWDGTDVSHNVVMDGDYSILIEMGWGEDKVNDHATKLFSFTKGPAAQNLTPEGTSNYSAISIDWQPATTLLDAVEGIDGINVFPNPAKDAIQLNFQKEMQNAKLEIVDLSGHTLYTEKVQQTASGVKSIDISNISPGLYLLVVSSEDNYFRYKFLVE